MLMISKVTAEELFQTYMLDHPKFKEMLSKIPNDDLEQLRVISFPASNSLSKESTEEIIVVMKQYDSALSAEIKKRNNK
jgi:hypothetical protein